MKFVSNLLNFRISKNPQFYIKVKFPPDECQKNFSDLCLLQVIFLVILITILSVGNNYSSSW